MPDGIVRWYDPGSGQIAVVRRGKRFMATTADVEPVARRAGARVHFDIRRDGGVERAVDVRLRTGTRVSHRQRRFGALTAARRRFGKGPAFYEEVHPGLHAAAERRPLPSRTPGPAPSPSVTSK